MKKVLIASVIALSIISCKKDKPEANNNCGIVTTRIVNDCDPQSGCSLSIAVDFPDHTSLSFLKNVPLNSTEYSVGSQYCKCQNPNENEPRKNNPNRISIR